MPMTSSANQMLCVAAGPLLQIYEVLHNCSHLHALSSRGGRNDVPNTSARAATAALSMPELSSCAPKLATAPNFAHLHSLRKGTLCCMGHTAVQGLRQNVYSHNVA
eukprot:GHRQ01023791.1.p2 GENE.GHRQ01023791.1~~GHRQ01023791.1.p2  ORF type:complete len:106 (+),score=7.05 GHRQ01023791.1:340-657(+)